MIGMTASSILSSSLAVVQEGIRVQMDRVVVVGLEVALEVVGHMPKQMILI